MKVQLGKEYPIENEQRQINEIVEIIRRNQLKIYGKGHMNRKFHAKMHACLQGYFIVDPKLPADLQVGTFIAGKQYSCWIRLSNGNVKVLDDRKRDLRGLAIKLCNVEGEFLVNDLSMPNTHDLVLVTHPSLMAANIRGFKKSIDALCNGFSGIFRFAVNPFNWPIAIRTLLSLKKHKNLFAETYYSVSPYRYGNGDRAVKYKLQPTTVNLTESNCNNPDFLQKTIISDLSKQSITFDLLVQFQEDAIRDPIEDATKIWHSSFHKIGTLVIKQQDFDPVSTSLIGDSLSFSPWHCTKEHQPLGGINRLRKAAYDQLSKQRILHNKDKFDK